MIETFDLVKRHGAVEVLRGVSLSVQKGEVAVIIGPSGGGKSTFLRCLNGLEGYQGGSVSIDGLRLEEDRTISWLRMSVLNDPGNAQAREAIEARLTERQASGIDRSRLVRVFTDRDAFIRAAGLTGSEHAWVLVLNRDGRVLARAEGAFDEDKARALRQTLLAHGGDF